MSARPGRGRGAASPGDLLTGTFAGQAQRFEDVYLREFASVFALAYAMLGSRWAAEDIAQDAFVVAHRQRGRVGGYEDPGAGWPPTWPSRGCVGGWGRPGPWSA